jgi:hypothetical protein
MPATAVADRDRVLAQAQEFVAQNNSDHPRPNGPRREGDDCDGIMV